MEWKIRSRTKDSLCSKGRHQNINVICAGHRVTDLAFMSIE